jgi:hypothetical protein
MLAVTRHADASVVDADVGDDIHGWDAYPLGCEGVKGEPLF